MVRGGQRRAARCARGTDRLNNPVAGRGFRIRWFRAVELLIEQNSLAELPGIKRHGDTLAGTRAGGGKQAWGEWRRTESV